MAKQENEVETRQDTHYRDAMDRILKKMCEREHNRLVGVRFCSFSGKPGPAHREKMAKMFCEFTKLEESGVLAEVSCNRL